jgi:hypothetical protein
MQNVGSVSVVNLKPLLEGQSQIANVDAVGIREILAKRVLSDIDRYAQVAYDDGHRKHLGASLMGRECRRFLWYTFRWVKKERFEGRMMRLFQRGHREEDRYAEYLRGIGFSVWLADDKGEQFRAPFAEGHGGGSLDAILRFPPSYGIDMPILGEFKTNNDGGFDKLVKEGVAKSKTDHWVQMCMYGSHPDYQFTHALYFNTNKNDDDMHVEFVKLDWKLGENMRRKGEQIIRAPFPPPKLTFDPTNYICRNCNFNGVCHKNEAVERNCRSCRHASPIPGKQWFCGHSSHNAVIPDEIIVQGCGLHETVNVEMQ